MFSPYALDPSAEPGAPRYGSVWSDTVDLPMYPPLERDTRADVVIVGAGSGIA